MYNVSCTTLLISLFKLFYAFNHIFLMLFRRSLSPAPEIKTGNFAPAETTSEAYLTGERMRRYTSAYVPMQNNASALGDLAALSWLAGMPALVCAGLESSTCLNFHGDSRRMRTYALGATGDKSIDSCADSRRMRAYTHVYARMEYKPSWSPTHMQPAYRIRHPAILRRQLTQNVF